MTLVISEITTQRTIADLSWLSIIIVIVTLCRPNTVCHVVIIVVLFPV